MIEYKTNLFSNLNIGQQFYLPMTELDFYNLGIDINNDIFILNRKYSEDIREDYHRIIGNKLLIKTIKISDNECEIINKNGENIPIKVALGNLCWIKHIFGINFNINIKP